MGTASPETNPTARSEVAGVILAGGASRRMFGADAGGGDKGLQLIDGQPILAHIIARLRPQVATLALSANGDPRRFAAFGLPVLPDIGDRHDGPLAGVLAGLTWAAAQPGVRAIVTVPSDVPFLPLDLVPRLLAGGIGLRVAQSADRIHPTVALWPLALRDTVAMALAEGRRKAMAFVETERASHVQFPFGSIQGQQVDPFFNTNTPEDLDAARRLLQISQP